MGIDFDGKEIMDIIYQLVNTPSPAGFTDSVIELIQAYLNKLDLSSWRNHKGGLITTLPGTSTGNQRMITAHVDALGAMVKEIKNDGRLKISLIGGSRWNHLEGEYCQIFASDNRIYSGTILMHQTSVHVY